MQRPIARVGRKKTVVYAVCSKSDSPGQDFFNALDSSNQAKMNALFVRMADHGVIVNEEKFKKITGTNFFEFKSHQIRMPCYHLPGQLLVVTHGFFKRSDRTPPAEIEKAERIPKEDEDYFVEHGDTSKWRT